MDDRLGIDDGRELSMQIAQRNGLNVFRRIADAVGSDAIKRRSCIGNYPRDEAEILRHSRRGRDAVVRRQSGNDQIVLASLSQFRLQRCADKTTVDALLDH